MKDLLAVGIGGAAGAMARYAVASWIPLASGFPTGTLTVNLIGCFLLAWLFTAGSRRARMHPRVKLAAGTGFIGSFTTFSTFSVEILELLSHHQLMPALLYVLASVVGGLGAAFLGFGIALLHAPREGGTP